MQVKVVADPAMHSMPAVARHPNGKMLAFQSLDSRIVTYSCTGKFRPNKKKVFSGHLVGGTACQVRPPACWCMLVPCWCQVRTPQLRSTARSYERPGRRAHAPFAGKRAF